MKNQFDKIVLNDTPQGNAVPWETEGSAPAAPQAKQSAIADPFAGLNEAIEAASGKFDELPFGSYQVMLEEAYMKETKNGTPMALFMFTVLNGEQAKRKTSISAFLKGDGGEWNSSAIRKWRLVAEAIGVPKDKFEDVFKQSYTNFMSFDGDKMNIDGFTGHAGILSLEEKSFDKKDKDGNVTETIVYTKKTFVKS